MKIPFVIFTAFLIVLPLNEAASKKNAQAKYYMAIKKSKEACKLSCIEESKIYVRDGIKENNKVL